MITAGLVLLLFAAYEVWGKAVIVSGHQKRPRLPAQPGLGSDPADPTVAAPPPGAAPTPTAAAGPLPAPPGGSIAPALPPPARQALGGGARACSRRTSSTRPGHYPDTALPGQIGNFSVAGHRSPAIFWDLDQMQGRRHGRGGDQGHLLRLPR